ncbi:MAG: virulence factor SrfB [Limisphaerales bacterium]
MPLPEPASNDGASSQAGSFRAVAEAQARPAVIDVFADTGHHFAFVPFAERQLRDNPELEKLCRNNDFPWCEVRDTTGTPLRWLRYQFAQREAEGLPTEESGVLLAIETNLGNAHRGWALQPEETVSPADAAKYTPADKVATPYVFPDATRQPAGGVRRLSVYLPLTPTAPRDSSALARSLSIDLEIHWLESVGRMVDVDLIVDFGNTRSVALLLTRNQAARGTLSEITQPVRFGYHKEEPRPAAKDAEDSFAMIDSWLVLQETTFANLEPLDHKLPPYLPQPVEDLRWEEASTGVWPLKKRGERVVARTLRQPHLFVEMSPAVLGPPAADILANLEPGAGGNYFLSSPKRYLWDQTPVGDLSHVGLTFWTMNVQRWHPNSRNVQAGKALEKLSGTVLRFLDQNGDDWTLGDDGSQCPPPERADAAARPPSRPHEPAYPRADALTWAALAVLEAAYRQLQSASGRPAGQPFVRARLASVTVTFPPGWTAQELDAYRRKWQKALDIFTLTHFADRRLVTAGGDRPTLGMELDEAVAAQLPLIFDEMRRMGQGGGSWLELVGRGHGAMAKARVLNLDIGGGTTDLTLVEYQDQRPGEGVDLVATVLYRDSSTIAGDGLVRRIIESVLLPALAQGLDPGERRAFAALLARQKGEDRARWNRITRQVFLPIVHGWLAAAAREESAAQPPPTPRELRVNLHLIEEFNALCQNAGAPARLIEPDTALVYSQERLAECIRQNFAGLFGSLAKVVEAFDCDLVLVSGKPSELAALRSLLRAELPLLSHRILFAKDAFVGEWYPLSLDGRIHDAKTVTVAGAALYQAIKRGLMGPGWHITRKVSPHLLTRNYWGTMPKNAQTRFGTLLLAPNQDRNQCRLQIGDRLGRRMLPADTRPEPVYILQWRDRNRYRSGGDPVNALLTLTLERVSPSGSAADEAEQVPQAEALRIVAVDGFWNGQRVTGGDVELALCTLEAESHWLDAGTFQII